MNYLNLDREKLGGTIKQLNTLLANYHIYYQNLRNFHWNVKGVHFFDLHKKFEELYNDAKVKIDEISERILTLRHRPTSRLSEYLDMTSIKEGHGEYTEHQMVEKLLTDHEVLIDNMRKLIKEADKANDEGTIDMVAGFLFDLEKNSWMLDAWISKTTETRNYTKKKG